MQEICGKCDGAGSIKIPGGVSTCRACYGTCWVSVSSSEKENQLAEKDRRIAELEAENKKMRQALETIAANTDDMDARRCAIRVLDYKAVIQA